MATNFVLVHSPIVGPASWRPVAGVLRGGGQRAVVPSLLPALQRSSGFAAAIAEEVREAVEASSVKGPLVLAGHSAAGAYLPVIGSRLGGRVGAYLFVDARLPRRDASLDDEDGPAAVADRREMAEEGWLPPWSQWFPAGVLRAVLPDDDRRERFLAELPPIPLALFGETITFPAEWPDAPCGYLRLSEFYKPLAREAANKGWPVAEIDAQHLHLLVDPEAVADLLLELLGRMEMPFNGS